MRKLKTALVFLFSIVLILNLSAEKPNIVFVFADQWRAQDVGYNGNNTVKTPAIDKLAQESVMFKNAVSGCPVCSPYRASLLTGQYPLTHGVFYNDKPLNPNANTIAKIYKEAGYETGYIGKWHINGHEPGEKTFEARKKFIPKERRQGFDFWQVLECTHNYNNSYYYEDTDELKKWDGYDAIAQTRSAIKFIEDKSRNDNPFLLFLSWGPPHAPYHTAPEKYRKMYPPQDIALRSNVPPELKDKARKDIAGYYAHITALDDCMSELIQAIDDAGIKENTIFVFTSDHGDMLYSHGSIKKQQPWDESIMVPLLLRYPGKTGSEGEIIHTPINTPDILPTILGLSGIKIPSSVEGEDFTPIIMGKKNPTNKAALIQCPVPFHQWSYKKGGREFRGIRTERYTYVRDLNGPWILYDNLNDPFQLENLIDKPELQDKQKELDNVLSEKLKNNKDDFLPGKEYMKKWNYHWDGDDSLQFTQVEINAKDYGLSPDEDATPAVINALEACSKVPSAKLIIPKGVYHFYPDFGVDRYFSPSNNDEGLKRVIFPIFHQQNLTVEGNGSKFIFHGFVNPFILSESSNVTLKNFSIDFHRSFHSEGKIINVRDDGIDVEIPEQFPFRIINGVLQFTDFPDPNAGMLAQRNLGIYDYRGLLEFNPERRETAYMVKDYHAPAIVAESLGGRKVRLYDERLKPTKGNIMTFKWANRNHPGFIVTDCSDITFKGITIYHSGGMGIIGQRTHNIKITDCKVTPSEGRIVSATADATHFVNCTGKIELGNNLFENQMDDATNIHGIYVQVKEKTAPNEIIVKLLHRQQFGFDFIEAGDMIEFIHGKSMIIYDTLKVKKAIRMNKEYTRVVFEDNLSDELIIGDAVSEIRDYPEVHIHNNIIRKNRARGMLLNCRGKTVVENNYFHSPGAALLFEGDAHFWFEQGGVTDCVIRNNVFDNCLFGVWGKAVIDVKSGVQENLEFSRYNKNIKIIDNEFRIFDDAPLLNVYCVDGLLWERNKIEYKPAYEPARTNMERFIVNYSDNVRIIE